MFSHIGAAAREHGSSVFIKDLDPKTFVGFLDPDILFKTLEFRAFIDGLQQFFLGLVEFLFFHLGNTDGFAFVGGLLRRDVHADSWHAEFGAQCAFFCKAGPAEQTARTRIIL